MIVTKPNVTAYLPKNDSSYGYEAVLHCEFVNTVTNKKHIMDRTVRITNSMYYTLSFDLPVGEYTYTITEDDSITSTGLLRIIGDKDSPQIYKHNNDYVVYEG